MTKISESDSIILHTVKPNLISFEKLWPPDLTAFDPERFEKQIKLALIKNIAIARCEPMTILESLLQAAELGLDPSGSLGSSWLVPYGPKCQLVIGYRGMIDLASRAGVVRSIEGFVVREKDEFDYVAGKLPWHKPYLPKPTDDQDPGPIWAAWAIAVMPGPSKKVDVMSLRELDAIRARSRAKNGPWSGQNSGDLAEMYKKTVIRRLLKSVPMSPSRAKSLARAMEIEDAQFEESLAEKDVTPVKSVRGSKAIAEKLGLDAAPEAAADGQVDSPA